MSTLTPPAAPQGAPGPSDGRGGVPEYVAAVRRALHDLPPEAADDLVDGLEGDLHELAAESSTPLADRLGPPHRYADELREAAGLPRRADGSDGQPRRAPAASRADAFADALVDALVEALVDARTRLRRQRWWAPVASFADALRPAWWVARAWVALALAAWWWTGVELGADDLDLVVLVAFAGLVVVSTWAGQGRWSHHRWARRALVAGNVLAVLAVPSALGWLSSPQPSYEPVSTGAAEVAPPSGLYLDGLPVSNLHPYDAKGVPLAGVQLLDDFGRPVQVGEDNRVDWSQGSPRPFQPAVDAEGTVRWNVFPMQVPGGGVGLRPEEALPPLLVPAPTAPAPAAAPPAADPSPS